MNLFRFVVFSGLFLFLGCGRAFTLHGYGVERGKPVFVNTNASAGRVVTPLKGADANSFRILSQPHNVRYCYAADIRNAYMASYRMQGADGASLEILSDDGLFTRDSSHVFFQGVLIPNADRNSFKQLNEAFAKDAENAFIGAVKIPVIDLKSWKPLGKGVCSFPWYVSSTEHRVLTISELSGYGWSKDQFCVYLGEIPVHEFDARTFELIGDSYSRDKHHVYHRENIVVGADPHSFAIIPGPVYSGPDAADARNRYRSGRVFEE